MEGYNFEEVKNCYDATAGIYSERLSNELDGKPFDRITLQEFAKTINAEDCVIEFGSGSGHISKYLYDYGVKQIIATDISTKSIVLAAEKYPEIKFEYQNMLKTTYEDNSINGIVCFYGIVHFTYFEIEQALVEWIRILKKGGKVLFCFHIGNNESVTVENFMDTKNAKATWNFFIVDSIIGIMEKLSIEYSEIIIRYPYLGKEHPSKRCYIQFGKSG